MRRWWVLVLMLLVCIPGAWAQSPDPSASSRNVESKAAGPVDLPEVAARLAKVDGGFVDAGAGIADPGKAKLEALVAEWRARGRRLWVLGLPRGVDLVVALRAVSSRLAPGDMEAIVVASPDGVRARLPALAGAPEKISEAFEASRRELTADLAAGTVAFVKRLDEAVEARIALVRRVALGMFVALAVIALLLLVRVARFRAQQRTWDRADAKDIARIVGECQERLQRLAGAPSFDALYAELQSWNGKPPAEAGPALERLRAKLDEAVERGEKP